MALSAVAHPKPNRTLSMTCGNGESFLYQMRYAVGLYDDAMGSAVAERVTDRIAIRQKAIGRNLRLSDDATAQVAQKFQRGIGIPLADAMRL
jgi:hypothetical protein